MTFSQQVRLFNTADYVIAPHGAGLSNLIFSKDATVIEIFGENVIKPTYFLLSSLLDHKYSFILGKQPGNSRDAEIHVPINQLESLLNKIVS